MEEENPPLHDVLSPPHLCLDIHVPPQCKIKEVLRRDFRVRAGRAGAAWVLPPALTFMPPPASSAPRSSPLLLLPFLDLLVDNTHEFLQSGLIHKPIAFLGAEEKESRRDSNLPVPLTPSSDPVQPPRPESPSWNGPASRPQTLQTPLLSR